MTVIFTIMVIDEGKMKAVSTWPTSVTHTQLSSTCALPV